LCNDAVLKENQGSERLLSAVGDPTEGALVVASARFGLEKPLLDQAFPRIHEIPFDSDRKRMTTVHEFPDSLSRTSDTIETGWWQDLAEGDAPYSLYKGRLWTASLKYRPMYGTETIQRYEFILARQVVESNEKMTSNGMRVVGLAFRPVEEKKYRIRGRNRRDLIFSGLVGMIDPPRPEVKKLWLPVKNSRNPPVMTLRPSPDCPLHCL